MKILFRCDEYPPYISGGIGSVTKIVAEELTKRGHDIFIVGTYEFGHDLPHFSEVKGVKIYRLTHFEYVKYVPTFLSKYVNKLLNVFSYLSRNAIKANNKIECFIECLSEKEKIEIIELVDYNSIFKFFKKEVQFNGFSIPTVMRVHGSLSFINYYSGIKNDTNTKNDINNFLRCDKISAVSKFSEAFVNQELNINNIPSTVVYNPVEDHFLKNSKIEASSDYILFIGKITETKGAFSLLRAFNIIAKKNPDIKLILLGGGDIEKAKTILENEYVDRVIFKGYVNRSLIKEYIDKSLFCVIPTYFENFSMVALEVMARGKALVYSDLTSGTEIIDDYSDGLLITPTDINQIAEKIEILLNNETLRKRIGEEAYLKIKKKFTVSKIISELEILYKSSVQ